MAAILKGHAAANARVPAFAAGRLADIRRPDPADVEPACVDPRALEIVALHAEIEQLRTTAADMRAAHQDALDQRYADGKRAGLAQAEADDAARLSALNSALANAQASFDTQLKHLDRLAPALAERAVAKLVGESAAANFGRFVATQVAALGDAVINVIVSDQDVADIASLIGGVRTDPMLASGEARIECRLGMIDLSLPGQASELAALLSQLAEARP